MYAANNQKKMKKIKSTKTSRDTSGKDYAKGERDSETIELCTCTCK